MKKICIIILLFIRVCSASKVYTKEEIQHLSDQYPEIRFSSVLDDYFFGNSYDDCQYEYLGCHDKKDEGFFASLLEKMEALEHLKPGINGYIISQQYKKCGDWAYSHNFGRTASGRARERVGENERARASLVWNHDQVETGYQRFSFLSRDHYTMEGRLQHRYFLPSDVKKIHKGHLVEKGLSHPEEALFDLSFLTSLQVPGGSQLRNFSERKFSLKEKLSSVEQKNHSEHLLLRISRSYLEALFPKEADLKKNSFTEFMIDQMIDAFGMMKVADQTLQKRIENDENLQRTQESFVEMCDLYDLFHHHLYIILSYHFRAGKPLVFYHDYKKSMKEFYIKKIQSAYLYDQFINSFSVSQINNFIFHNYLYNQFDNTNHNIEEKDFYTMITKSGMSATLISALACIQDKKKEKGFSYSIMALSEQKHGACNKIYYEIESLLRRLDEKFFVELIFTGMCLENYTKREEYYMDCCKNIVDRVKDTENPKVLVIDTTLHSCNWRPVQFILKNLTQEKENGKVAFLLTRSHQKFDSLGCQKERSGNITLYGNLDKPWIKFIKKNLEEYDTLTCEKEWGHTLQWVMYLLGEKNGFDYACAFEEKANINISKFMEYYQKENFNLKNYIYYIKKYPQSLTERSKTSQSCGVFFDNQCRSHLKNHSLYPEESESFGFTNFSMGSSYPAHRRYIMGLEPESLVRKIAQVFFNKRNEQGYWCHQYNSSSFDFANSQEMDVINDIIAKLKVLKNQYPEYDLCDSARRALLGMLNRNYSRSDNIEYKRAINNHFLNNVDFYINQEEKPDPLSKNKRLATSLKSECMERRDIAE